MTLSEKTVYSSRGHNFHVRFMVLCHRLCKAFRKTVYFQNKYGVKALNKPLFDNENAAGGETVVLKPEQLHLGFDGLKEEYTLCGTVLTESPHYGLMDKMNQHSPDFKKCNYILREKYGYLDGRMGCVVDEELFQMHTRCFAKSSDFIHRGKQKEVLVYTIAGSYYILDGKHTAALCAVLGEEIRCRPVDLSLISRDLYHKRLFANMKKRPMLYGKNIALLNEMMKAGLNTENLGG